METRSAVYKVLVVLTTLFVVISVALPHHHHHDSAHEICFVLDHCGDCSDKDNHEHSQSDPCGSCPLDNQPLISSHPSSEHKCSIDSCDHHHDEDQSLPGPLFVGIISLSDLSMGLTSRPVVYIDPEVGDNQKNHYSTAQLRAPPVA